jgi:nicotinamide riboside kinase
LTILINLYGGPGSGKSTIAAHTFALLKHSGVNSEYVQEYAKDLVWADTPATLDYPIALFGEQHTRIARLWDKVDVIVTDSPILLCAYYAGTVERVYNSEPFQALALHEDARFRPALNAWIRREKPYEPAGRVQSEAQALRVDRSLRAWLKGRGVALDIEIPGDQDAAHAILAEVVQMYSRANRRSLKLKTSA